MADRGRVSSEGAGPSNAGPRKHECTKCNEPLDRAWTFCPSCGERAPGLRTGEIIDERYEILDLLSRHGAREVYRARHLHLDEIRVVKILNGDLFHDDAQVFRFRQEAKLASRLRHPNVATLHEFASLGGGTFYTAWEFLEGETAADRMRRMGTLSVNQALDVGAQVANGLAAIHAAGVVHRSISPQNIMLLPDRAATREGGSDRVKIIDFGIATALAATDSDQALRRGYADERYAAPEQIEVADGSARPVDERADIYSLGATLFELLTGRLPSRSVDQTEHSDIPPTLSKVLTSALEKDPAKRFRSAAEMREALLEARRSGETAAATPKSEVPSRKLETASPKSETAVPFTKALNTTLPAAPALSPDPPLVVPSVPLEQAPETDWSAMRQPPAPVEPVASVPGSNAPPLRRQPIPVKAFWLVPLLLLLGMAALAMWNSRKPAAAPAQETVTAAPAVATTGAPAPVTGTAPMVLPPNVESATIVEEDGTPVQSLTIPTELAEESEPEEGSRVTASEASNLLLNGLRARQYYKVPASCVRVGDIRYVNQGYTIEVRTRTCGDARVTPNALLGRWRVDARTGELYVQNARGKFVDP
jgi:serine/threonine protein kinase